MAPIFLPQPRVRAAVRRLGLRASIALFVGAFSIGGCSSEPASTLSVGLFPWAGYEPFFLAESLGYTSKKSVRLVDFASSTQTLRALRNGVIQAAALTTDELLLALEDVPDLRAVLLIDVSHGADVLLAQPEVHSLAALRGQRVGYEPTALGAFVLSRALEAGGLSPADVTTVSLQPDQHETAFATRAVDAVVTFEPARTRLLAAKARQLWDSSQRPGEIVDVLVVREADALAHGDALVALMKGWFRAVDYLKTNPSEAHRRIGPRLNLSSEETAKVYHLIHFPGIEENRAFLQGAPSRFHKLAKEVDVVMRRHQFRARTETGDDFVDPSFLARLK